MLFSTFSSSINAPAYIVTNIDNSDMYIRSFSINYISNSSFHINFNSESTSNNLTLIQNGQGSLYFCDMPLYHMFYSNGGVQGDYTYKTVDSMIDEFAWCLLKLIKEVIYVIYREVELVFSS